MLKITFLLFGITVISYGQPSKDCLEYGDKAMQSLYVNLSQNEDSTHLYKTLALFDKAIKCNSSNLNILQGKFTALYLLGRYPESINVLNEIYIKSSKSDSKVLTFIGLVYEKMNLMDSARITYERALVDNKRQLSRHPQDSIQLFCDELFILAAFKGKDYSIKKLEDYMVRNPDDPMLETMKEYLRDFDKNRLLYR